MIESPGQDANTRYSSLAKTVINLIESGTLRPGERAPSLRALAKGHQVSVTTAMAAYQLLEQRGFLEARPQSGYYVLDVAKSRLAPPAKSADGNTPRRVVVTSKVTELLELIEDETMAPLGCAIPSPELLNSRPLNYTLARLAKTRGVTLNSYGSPRGEESLRRVLSTRMMSYGCVVSPSDIVTTCGCSEALSLALQVVAQPGDTVAIESPTYFGLLQVLQSLGLKALELATDPATGIDVSSLEQVLENNSVRVCLFSSSFGNPLGGLMPHAQKRHVLDLLARYKIPLIEDDIYGDLWFGAARPRPWLALGGKAQVIYCSSFSKTLAPGYRVGWVTSKHYIQRLVERRAATTLCGPALPQLAIAQYLTGNVYEKHLRKLRATLEANVVRIAALIEAHFPQGTRASKPLGGFVIWVQLPNRINSRRLYEAALSEGICFAPGDLFTAGKSFRNCLRLSAGHVWGKRIEESVVRLGELASSMNDSISQSRRPTPEA